MRSYTKDELILLITLWKNGIPPDQIAKQLDRNEDSIKFRIKKFGQVNLIYLKDQDY